jgi:hypothetical protein
MTEFHGRHGWQRRRCVRFVAMLVLFASCGVCDDVLMAVEPNVAASDASTDDAKKSSFDPSDKYESRKIEGWTIRLHSGFASAQPELCDETLILVREQLRQIIRKVPAPAVEKLRSIPIWVEEAEPHHACMAYHPDAGWLRANNMNPDKARCVELANAKNFLSWTKQQPWMILHELAHGYHHQFVEGGFEHPELAECLDQAKSEKLYDTVLRIDGRSERAYALTNQQEYFAEQSEAYFGTNDFYPFVRPELSRHDPRMFALLEKLWGVGR